MQEEEPIKFIQKSESTKPKFVLVHISGLETFICSLNPAASLYEDVADSDKVFEYFSKLKEYLKEKDIKLITVEEALSSIVCLRQLFYRVSTRTTPVLVLFLLGSEATFGDIRRY